jgi:hypothetical protein
MSERDLIRVVDEIVAPLASIQPAERIHARNTRRRELVAIAIAVLLLLIAVAATVAAYELTAEADPTPVSPGGSLACLDLVAGTAGHAERVLGDRGYRIEWQLLDYQAGGFFSQTQPDSVASSAVVEDVEAAEDRTVIVFVHAADDPDAPVPRPVPCPQ